MKIVIIFILLLNFNVFPQNEFAGRVGFAIGYTPNVVLMNFINLDNELKNKEFPLLSDQIIFKNTLEGYAYLMIIDNLRTGFYISSGSRYFEKRGTFINSVNYATSDGGILAEYTLPISDINISIGSYLGIGNSKITLSSISSTDWNDFTNSLNSQSNSVYRSITLNCTEISFSPCMNIEYTLNRFVALRAGGGYTFNFRSDWKSGNDIIKNSTVLLPNGAFNLKFGLMIGFFSK